MEDKNSVAFYLICPKCGYKKAIYGPFPLSDFTNIVDKNKYCDICKTEIENITASNYDK